MDYIDSIFGAINEFSLIYDEGEILLSILYKPRLRFSKYNK